MGTKPLLPRIVVAQDVAYDRSRVARRDPRHGMMLGGKKFRTHGDAVPCQTRVSAGKIDKTNLGIAQDETCAVVAYSSWKFEAPLLQLEKSPARAELAQGKNCGNIERATERLTQTHRTEITMIVILRVVIRVLVANGLGGVRQQARSGQKMSIYCGEIDERFQCRAATAQAHRAVDLVCRIVVRTNHCPHRAGFVVEDTIAACVMS